MVLSGETLNTEKQDELYRELGKKVFELCSGSSVSEIEELINQLRLLNSQENIDAEDNNPAVYDNITEETVEDTAEIIVEEPIEEITEEPVEETAEETVEEIAEETIEEIVEEPVENIPAEPEPFVPAEEPMAHEDLNTPVSDDIVCTYCGNKLTSDMVFCDVCGNRIIKPEPVKPAEVFSVPDDKEYENVCPNCGKKSDDDMLFCGDCGCRLVKREIFKNQPSDRCSVCGAPLSAGAKFCLSCGSRVR